MNITGLVTLLRYAGVLLGGTANDTFNVRGFATGTPQVNGTTGTDTLNYDSLSVPVTGNLTPPDGSIESAGLQPVVFTQIEAVNLVNPFPMMTISDVTAGEGGSPSAAIFNVTLANPSLLTVTVNFATADGSAVAPGDYTAQSGALTFAPGETVKTVTVPIAADSAAEPTETFVVNLSGAVNAGIGDNQDRARSPTTRCRRSRRLPIRRSPSAATPVRCPSRWAMSKRRPQA